LGTVIMTKDPTLYETRYALFNSTGPRYDLIMPVFGPLAENLVKLADLQPQEKVLDLGTGTGAAVFPAGRIAQQVVGIDYAPTMLAGATKMVRAAREDHVTFCQGDMHRLPQPDNYFAVALASFGLNGIDPNRVFPEVRRVMKQGGRLVFQEWGEVDDASQLVKQTVQAHKIDRAEGFLAELRCLGQKQRAWDKLGGPEAIADLLQKVGFSRVKTIIEREAIPLEPLTFYRYKTAWTPYQTELAAMSPPARQTVETEALEALRSWTESNGRFIWKPELMRMIAWK
jgi:ubiquinone/menaquinone biosynthesis C-methylase UbiE